MIVAPELAELVFDGILGGALQPEVEGGAHHEGAVRNRAKWRRVDELAHFLEGVVKVISWSAFVAPIDRARRIAAGAEHLTLGHKSGVNQVVQHHIGAAASRRQVDVGGEFGRRLEQARQHRGLR